MLRTNSGSLVNWKFRSNISPYSMNPLLFEVFFLWEAKKRNFFTRLLVPLVLLRTEQHTPICRHLSVFPCWKSLGHSRISRLVTKKTIFPKKRQFQQYFMRNFSHKAWIKYKSAFSGLPSLAFMHSKPGHSARPPFMNTVYTWSQNNETVQVLSRRLLTGSNRMKFRLTFAGNFLRVDYPLPALKSYIIKGTSRTSISTQKPSL